MTLKWRFTTAHEAGSASPGHGDRRLATCLTNWFPPTSPSGYISGMTIALKLPSHHMTITEFLSWVPEGGIGALWQLRDGEPEMMAPASDTHRQHPE